MAKVSIVVPVYNQEKYLAQCVDTILNQSYSDLEIILVDDGSTDNSNTICDAYSAKDSRVQVIHKVNGGLSDARNAGIEVATGDYFLFVDSDDYIAMDMVEKLVHSIEINDADMAVCDACLVNSYSEPLASQNKGLPDKCYTGLDIMAFKGEVEYMEQWLFMVAWNKLYRRKLFEKLRYPKGKIHEDEFVFYDLYTQVAKVVCVPEKLYFYRRHEATITAKPSVVALADRVEALCIRSLKYCALPCIEMLYEWDATIYQNISRIVGYSRGQALSERSKEVIAQAYEVVDTLSHAGFIDKKTAKQRMRAYRNPKWYFKKRYYIDRVKNKICR